MRFRNFHAGCCGYVPTRSDGSEWAHVLTLRDSSTVYADTVDELLEEVLEGWTTMGQDERREALLRHATEAAQELQQRKVAEARARGAFDPADPDDRAVLHVLEADKRLSILLETPDAPGEQAPWAAAVELVLLTTSYQPHGDHPPITGRVVWLDPSGPHAYIGSLRDAGLYDYWALDEHDARKTV